MGEAGLAGLAFDLRRMGAWAGAGRSPAEVLARYGDGLAQVDRRGELSLDPAVLFGSFGEASQAAGMMLGAGETFTDEFALTAAEMLIDVDFPFGRTGAVDSRALAVEQVARHGGDAAVALFGRLGDDYLDDLLWNPTPIMSSTDVHPVFELFAPVLDQDLVPGLGAELVTRAGASDQRLALPTGQVVEFAMFSDVALLSPMAIDQARWVAGGGTVDRVGGDRGGVHIGCRGTVVGGEGRGGSDVDDGCASIWNGFVDR